MKRGRFVSFEGGEGAGKSSLIAAASAGLTAAGVPHLTTREPGGTPFAEALRRVLLDPAHRGLCATAELLAVFAARADHVERMVEPTLASGRWVLSDRFVDASYAYQGGGRGVPPARIDELAQWSTGGLMPDRTFLLDLPVSDGLQRARLRGAPDRMEAEAEEFFDHVRAVYRARALAEPGRFVLLDALRPLPEVVANAERELAAMVSHWREQP